MPFYTQKKKDGAIKKQEIQHMPGESYYAPYILLRVANYPYGQRPEIPTTMPFKSAES